MFQDDCNQQSHVEPIIIWISKGMMTSFKQYVNISKPESVEIFSKFSETEQYMNSTLLLIHRDLCALVKLKPYYNEPARGEFYV